jgi:hypothetical protein
MPNLAVIPGNAGNDGYSINWHVPIDDTSHWRYTFVFWRSAPPDLEVLEALRLSEMGPDYRLIRNQSNRYLQDRGELQTKWFAGLGPFFPAHDAWATESAGPVQDRTQERLGYTDRAIIAARRLLLTAIDTMEEGGDPQGVIRDERASWMPGLVVRTAVLPTEAACEAWQRAAREGEKKTLKV